MGVGLGWDGIIDYWELVSPSNMSLVKGSNKKGGKCGILPNRGEGGEGGGGAPREIKNQTPFLEKKIFSELVESFWDLQNMFYTWSGVHMSYLQP